MAQWLARGLLAALAVGVFAPAHGAERLRLIIETDAGGDPDDEQSLVRFLLYTCEWDVEGIIANRPKARPGENLNPARTGLDIVRRLVRAYGDCHPNLVQHDPRYPKPEVLLARTVAGYDETDGAVKLLLRAVDSPDPRPLWYSDWGTDHGAATNNLKRALDLVWRERGPDGYARFKNKLRLASYDKFGEHTRREPPWKFWVSTFQPEWGGKRWYHRFSALTATAGGFDLQRHVLTGHGPLGALYPTNTTHWQKEGDTMTFLYLVPTGMNDPQQPAWGSWAGRYGPRRDDFPDLPYYWANQEDDWQGTLHRDNTLRRWAAALQNDFRARLDWCVKSFRDANHPPQVRLRGFPDGEIVRVQPHTGESLMLDAGESSDPDAQPLNFDWFAYPEAGTYRGRVALESARSPRVVVNVPTDAAGRTIHLLVAATDTGQPPLTRYRRIVLTPRRTQ
jgi:hypothetical protein